MRKLVFATLSIALLSITACEQLEDLCGISADDLGFTEDYTDHLNAAIYIYKMSDLALRDSTLKASGNNVINGAQCTRTTDSLIIDFGNGVNDGGVTRYGSYRMAYSGEYTDPGSSASLKLHNFREGDQPYEGMVSLNNITAGSNPEIEITVTELKVDTLSLGGIVTAEWLSGFETQTDPVDDRFQLTGGQTLTNTSSNDAFVGTISSPLEIESSCQYTFVGGVVDLIPSNTKYPQLSIDFIDGDCANLFNATLDCEGNALSFSFPIQ